MDKLFKIIFLTKRRQPLNVKVKEYFIESKNKNIAADKALIELKSDVKPSHMEYYACGTVVIDEINVIK